MTEKTSKKSFLNSIVIPLALAQFICSYAASNMNVAISDIAHDLGTDVHGVQLAITFFTLTMAALMIPGSKLTDISGRKKIFRIGLIIYALGGLTAALAPVLSVLILGYSLLEGLGSALLIPPVYILVTVSYTGVARARNFGVISAAAGIGSAAGPLIGGIITTAVSWRASFMVQVFVVLAILLLTMKIVEPKTQGAPKHHFDIVSSVLSATGLVVIIVGLQTTSLYGWFIATKDFVINNVVILPQGSISPFLVFLIIGVFFNVLFYLSIRHRERIGKEPLLQTHILHNKTSNLGLVTQIVQWLILQGTFFVISVFLQTVRGFSAIETGLILTSATIGVLFTSGIAGRLAKKRSQRVNVRSGFVITIAGIALLLALSGATSNIFFFLPGLFLIGAGIGIMLTSSVNVVQSAFPEKDQGEISGLSRSISNLGSSLGVSIVGSVLVSAALPRNEPYVLALIVMAAIAVFGLIAAILIPNTPQQNLEDVTSSKDKPVKPKSNQQKTPVPNKTVTT